MAFVRNRQIWFAPIDGSKQPQQAFYARGTSESPAWSPDGRTLAFVSNRNDHSFIGLFTAGQPIRFIAPSTSRDSLPAWSPDGKKIAFLRQPGAGGAPRPPLARPEPPPWSILVADVESTGRDRPDDVRVITAVTSGHTPVDPILQNPGGIGLRWAADDALVYLSYRDGFPHLYSIQHPGAGQQTDAADARLVHGRTGHADARSTLRHLQREYRSGSERHRSPSSLQGAGECGDADAADERNRHRVESRRHRRRSDGGVSEFRRAAAAGSRRHSRLRRNRARDWRRSRCRRSSRRPNSSRRSWFRSAPATASKPMDNCSSPPAARHESRRSCTSTEAALDRCCSAGTIDGNTRMTTAPISIWRAAASSCCRSITG